MCKKLDGSLYNAVGLLLSRQRQHSELLAFFKEMLVMCLSRGHSLPVSIDGLDTEDVHSPQIMAPAPLSCKAFRSFSMWLFCIDLHFASFNVLNYAIYHYPRNT